MGWTVRLLSGIALLITLTIAQPHKTEKALALSGVYSRFNLHNGFRALTLGGLIFNLSTHELAKPISLPSTTTRQSTASIAPADKKPLCPLQMRLKVSETNGALQISLPDGLVATYGDCKPDKTLKSSTVALGNYASAMGGILRKILGPSFSERKMQFYSAALPTGVLQCKGDGKNDIDALSLVPIIDIALINFHTIFSAMGVSQSTFDDFFATVTSPTTSSSRNTPTWNTVYAQEAKRGLLRALKDLQSVSVLVLYRTSDIGKKGNSGDLGFLLSQQLSKIFSKEPPCMYVGSATLSPAVISKRIKTLVSTTIPLYYKRFLDPPQLPTFELYPTNDKCRSLKSQGEKISILKLFANATSQKETKMPLGVAKSFQVSVDKLTCSTTGLFRFLEAEPMLLRDGSKAALEAMRLANSLMSFQIKFGNYGSRIMKTSRFEKSQPEFSKILLSTALKSMIYVAQIDVTRCASMKNKKQIYAVLSNMPTALLYCNMLGMPKDHSYPCLNKVTSDNFDFDARHSQFNYLPPANGSLTTLPTLNFKLSPMNKGGMTAFLVQTGVSEMTCPYSSDENEAQTLRVATVAKTGKSGNANSIFSDTAIASPSASLTPPPSNRIPLPSGIAPGPGTSRTPSPSESMSPSASMSPPASSQSPSPSITSPDSGSVCFPSSATVEIRSGKNVTMDELQIGDEVLVGPGKYSAVLLFTHARKDVFTKMMIIESKQGRVALSPTHYLFVNGFYKAASAVRQGDVIATKVGHLLSEQKVVRVSVQYLSGLFNPHTACGYLLVRYGNASPILVSSYTLTVPLGAAHSLLSPLRGLYALTGTVFNKISGCFPETSVV